MHLIVLAANALAQHPQDIAQHLASLFHQVVKVFLVEAEGQHLAQGGGRGGAGLGIEQGQLAEEVAGAEGCQLLLAVENAHLAVVHDKKGGANVTFGEDLLARVEGDFLHNGHDAAQHVFGRVGKQGRALQHYHPLQGRYVGFGGRGVAHGSRIKQ